MEHALTVYTVTLAAEYMTGEVLESFSDDTEHKPQRRSKTIVQSSPGKESEIEHVMADLGFITKADDVSAIFKSCLTECFSTLQSRVMKAFEPTF